MVDYLAFGLIAWGCARTGLSAWRWPTWPTVSRCLCGSAFAPSH